MKTLITLALGFGFILTSVAGLSNNTSNELAFYTVTTEKSEGRVLHDQPPWTKIGYVRSEPELVITQLKEVNLREKPARSGFSEDSKTGKVRKATIYHQPELFFTLSEPDAAKVKALVEKSPADKLLVYFKGKPLSLRHLSDGPGGGEFRVAFNSANTSELERIADELRKMIRKNGG
jgi:hypothetical protein